MFPKKRFGQNFLRSEAVMEKIVLALAPQKADHFLEIGPGRGALTAKLLPLVARLDALEIDHHLIPLLQEKFAACTNFHLKQGDALAVNLADFATPAATPNLRIFGNLPYNIATPLMFRLFSQVANIRDMHFMLQKEVADHLIATVGSPHYGRLSVMTRYYCQSELLFVVSPQAFYPVPKIFSAFVRLTPAKYQVTGDAFASAQHETIFTAIVAAAFGQRRKQLHNSMMNFLPDDALARAKINDCEKELQLDFKKRPEELPFSDFVRIADFFCNKPLAENK